MSKKRPRLIFSLGTAAVLVVAALYVLVAAGDGARAVGVATGKRTPIRSFNSGILETCRSPATQPARSGRTLDPPFS